MRGCLVGGVTLVAMGFVAAALWFGVAGLLASDGMLARGQTAPTLAARPGTATPGAGADRPAAGPSSIVSVATASPPANDVMLARLTDADLTDALRREVAHDQGAVVIADPAVRVSDGAIELTGKLRGFTPFPIDVRVVGRITVQDGQPIVLVDRVEGVGLALPAMAARRLELLINSHTLVPLPPGVDVTRVDLGDGVLTVYGRRR